jgi:hypothetical protein
LRSRSPEYNHQQKRGRNEHRSSYDAEGEFSGEDTRNDLQKESTNSQTGSEHCESLLVLPLRVHITPIINQVDLLLEENETLKKAVETLKKHIGFQGQERIS